MRHIPLTQGVRVRRLTHVLIWTTLVLIAPLLLITAAHQLPPASAARQEQKLVEHTFKFDASSINPRPQRVNLAGNFNGWSRDATPMKRTRGDVWEATLKLPEGITFYKFVADGDRWITDPNSDRELEEDDGHGGKNSAVLIGPDWRKMEPPKSNHVNIDYVLYDPSDPADFSVADNHTVQLRVRVQKDDVQQVVAEIKPFDDGLVDSNSAVASELHKVGTELGFDFFRGAVRVPPSVKEVIPSVVLKDGNASFVIYDVGSPFALKPTFQTPEWARHVVWYQIFPDRFRNGDKTNDPGDFWYERFVPWTGDWWKAQPGEPAGDENFYQGTGNVWKRRYGGDIAGVKEKLPYLRELGINAIYFNPIFEAESMHKYDAADYRHVDDHFGARDNPKEQPVGAPERPQTAYVPIGNRQLFELDGTPVSPDYKETDDPKTWKWTKSDLIFLDFVQEAHRQGFKVVIDGVFNHVGRAHPFFQDVLAKGKNSKYADWFVISDWGDPANWRPMEDPYAVHGKPGGIQWKAWDKDNGHLPVFTKDDKKGLTPGPYEHIMAVTRRWLAPGGDKSKGVDGWRLDVPGDIPHGFWIDWRKVVKEANPDAYVTGEIWAPAQAWLQGDQFDAVMNYQFAMAAQDFFVDRRTAIEPSEFSRRLAQVIFMYPLQVSLVQQNLFDSHDTDRLASMFVNPDRNYDQQNRPQDNAREVGYDARRPNDEEWRRMLQAVAFQMTFVGAPMVYYGNEIGMFSPDDPSNRMPMWWKDVGAFENPDFRWDDRVFAFHQRAIAIRNKFEALRTGAFRPIVVDDEKDVFAFARDGGDAGSVFVVINRSDKAVRVEVPIGQTNGPLYDYLGDAAAVSFNDLQADARPTIAIKDGATSVKVNDGKGSVELKAYGTAIIAP